MSAPLTLQSVQLVIEISQRGFAGYAERHPEAHFTNDLEINPYHRQTQAGGIFLQFANGAPAFLWTEYGQIHICSGVHGNPKQIRDASSQLLRRTSAQPYRDGIMEVIGHFLGLCLKSAPWVILFFQKLRNEAGKISCRPANVDRPE